MYERIYIYIVSLVYIGSDAQKHERMRELEWLCQSQLSLNEHLQVIMSSNVRLIFDYVLTSVFGFCGELNLTDIGDLTSFFDSF